MYKVSARSQCAHLLMINGKWLTRIKKLITESAKTEANVNKKRDFIDEYSLAFNKRY